MAFDIYAIRDDTCNVTFDYKRCGQWRRWRVGHLL